ncbi:MAG: alpha/beta hydrolase [Proteobacteria bacterium]|nr:alpha/beta hydrolase [Pseudomonadota bacterium]
MNISLFHLLTVGYTKTANTNAEFVILLHGLARTKRSLLKLEHYLENKGFRVVNIGYPSRRKTIQELSVDTIPKAIEKCLSLGAGKIHFVTHSMGGILVRYYLENNKVSNLGRVVMLSPPNSGSEIVDKFGKSTVFKLINGPAGKQLGTKPGSIPKAVGPPDYEVGIITGDKTITPISSFLIPGKSDGKVSVESAKLLGMKDFLVVHKTHSFIMNDKKVLEQVTAFLKNGMFKID